MRNINKADIVILLLGTIAAVMAVVTLIIVVVAEKSNLQVILVGMLAGAAISSVAFQIIRLWKDAGR